MAVAVWLVVVGPALALWWTAGQQAREADRESAESLALATANRLEDFVGARLLAASAFARTLEVDPAADEQEFAARAGRLTERLEGLLALNWIHPDGTIVWIHPAEANAEARGRNVLRHPDAAEHAREAIDTRRPTRTPFLELFQGNTGFATYIPVVIDGELRGLVNAVFDIEVLARLLLEEDGAAAYRLREDGVTLYASRGVSASEPAMSRQALYVSNRRVELELVRLPEARALSWVRHVLLALGILLALLASVFAARWMRQGYSMRERLARERRIKRELRGLSRALIEAQERERGHLARELHDDVGQSLTLAKLVAAEARAGHLDELEQLERAVDDALESVRRISRELRPNVLHDLGLVPALRALVKKVRERSRREVVGRWPPRVELDPDRALCLYRIAQEALTNALKHADASRLELELEVDDEEIRLRVRDDGCGLRAPRGPTTGLSSMRERAAMCGGRLRVEAHPDGGTLVELRIPTDEGDSEASVHDSAAPLH